MLHGLLYHKIYKPIVLNYKNLLKSQLKWLDIIGDSKVVQKKTVPSKYNTITENISSKVMVINNLSTRCVT